jgi:hypothetical protein
VLGFPNDLPVYIPSLHQLIRHDERSPGLIQCLAERDRGSVGSMKLGSLLQDTFWDLMVWGASHLGTIVNRPCSLYAPGVRDIHSRRSQLPSPQTDRQVLGLIEAFRISIVPVQMEKEYRNPKKE